MSRHVICYCYHVSHVLNLGSIPARLAAAGWQVLWLNAFPSDSFPLECDAKITYRFDMPLEQVGQHRADLYLTPYVGQTAHFPQGARRVHFLVSLTSLDGVYDPSMFDHYDAIACAGRHHIEDFQQLGRARRWKPKRLIPMGYPKLDDQRRRLSSTAITVPSSPTVVFAPTHAYQVNQSLSVLRSHGELLVELVLGAGLNLVFRPHMESWRDQDRPVVERIVARFGGHPGFKLDRSGNYFETYAQSSLMLTDVSGTGFTYAFTFDRPAMFFAPNAAAEAGLTGIQFDRRENVGLVLRTPDELVPAIHAALKHQKFLATCIAEFRRWLLFNIGESEAFFAHHAHAIADDSGPANQWPVAAA
jgi:hypothetical protein